MAIRNAGESASRKVGDPIPPKPRFFKSQLIKNTTIMKNPFFFIILSVLSANLIGQRFDWVTSAGYVGVANSYYGAITIAKDSQGNIYTMDYGNQEQQCQEQTAEPLVPGRYNTFLYKFNPDGELIFIKPIGREFQTMNIVVDNEDNLYLLGYNNSDQILIDDLEISASEDFNYVLKLSPNGEYVWHYELGTFFIVFEAPLLFYHNNHIYVQDERTSIIKIDTNGNLQETLAPDAFTPSTAINSIQFKNAGVLASGELVFIAESLGDVVYGDIQLFDSSTTAVERPLLILKTNEDLEVQSAVYIQGLGIQDKIHLPMVIGNDNGIYLGVQVDGSVTAGNTTVVNPNPGTTDFVDAVLKMNAEFQGEWIQSFTTNPHIYALHKTADGSGIFCAGKAVGSFELGEFEINADSGDSFLAKLDDEGNFLNALTFGINTFYATTLSEGEEGEYYVGGVNSSFEPPIFSCIKREPSKGLYLAKFYDLPDTPPVPTIIRDGNLLTASPEFEGEIQWFLDNEPISGANGQTYLAAETGTYSVAYAYENACETVSDDFAVENLGIHDFDLSTLSVYPNPATDKIYFSKEILSLTVYNLQGQKMSVKFDANSADVFTLPAGVYVLKIQDANGIFFTTKIIKN